MLIMPFLYWQLWFRKAIWLGHFIVLLREKCVLMISLPVCMQDIVAYKEVIARYNELGMSDSRALRKSEMLAEHLILIKVSHCRKIPYSGSNLPLLTQVVRASWVDDPFTWHTTWCNVSVLGLLSGTMWIILPLLLAYNCVTEGSEAWQFSSACCLWLKH